MSTKEQEEVFDDEYLTATTLVRNALVDFEDATGRTSTNIIIPNALEIQSVVMLVCEHMGIEYETSEKAKEVYCA